MVALPGPSWRTVMVFPVCRFVYEAVTAPVKRNVVDPSAVLRTLVYSLLTGNVTRSLNTQNDAGRVKGGPPGGCHLGPRPARAGEAVTTPPNRPSSAPSATMTPSRLMTIPPNPVALAECEPMLCAVGQAAERHDNAARRAPYRWSRMPARKLRKAAWSVGFVPVWFWDANTKAVPWRTVTAISTRKPLPAGHCMLSSRAGAPPMVMAWSVFGGEHGCAAREARMVALL